MRLLLVEDSQRLREGLQAGLADAGFAVDGAAGRALIDAHELWAYHHHDEEPNPTDRHMPPPTGDAGAPAK